MANITPEEIKALVGAKIKGQGTAVDMGSVLPAILNGLADNISDLINNKGLQFGGVITDTSSEFPKEPNTFYLCPAGEYDFGPVIEAGYIGIIYTDKDGELDSVEHLLTGHTDWELTKKVRSVMNILTYSTDIQPYMDVPFSSGHIGSAIEITANDIDFANCNGIVVDVIGHGIPFSGFFRRYTPTEEERLYLQGDFNFLGDNEYWIYFIHDFGVAVNDNEYAYNQAYIAFRNIPDNPYLIAYLWM